MQFSIHDRIARRVLDKLMREEGTKKSKGISRETTKDGHAALMILVSFPVLVISYCFMIFSLLSRCLCSVNFNIDYNAEIEVWGFYSYLYSRYTEVIFCVVFLSLIKQCEVLPHLFTTFMLVSVYEMFCH